MDEISVNARKIGDNVFPPYFCVFMQTSACTAVIWSSEESVLLSLCRYMLIRMHSVVLYDTMTVCDGCMCICCKYLLLAH